VEITESTHHRDPLDILRRLVATPLRRRVQTGNVLVLVQTNDFTLLPAFPLAVASPEVNSPLVEWKLVRDYDAFGLLEEPIRINSETLTIVAMGTACLIGLDHECRELLCFIGADVDARTFQDVLVPFFCQLTNEVTCAEISHSFQTKCESAIDA